MSKITYKLQMDEVMRLRRKGKRKQQEADEFFKKADELEAEAKKGKPDGR